MFVGNAGVSLIFSRTLNVFAVEASFTSELEGLEYNTFYFTGVTDVRSREIYDSLPNLVFLDYRHYNKSKNTNQIKSYTPPLFHTTIMPLLSWNAFLTISG